MALSTLRLGARQLQLATSAALATPATRRQTARGLQTISGARDVYIVSTARTPIGSFRSKLASLSVTELGTIAAKGAIERAGIPASAIQEAMMGNVIAAGAGQAPTRQVLLGAGGDVSTACTTINKVCASGMKSVMLAAQSIQLGHQDVILAGGMESMSNVPYILRKARAGLGYGDHAIEDLILNDGLTDVYNQFHMGCCGEDTAEKYNITREQQDDFALMSYARSAAANEAGKLAKEIVPVTIKQRRGDPLVIDEDEEFRNVSPEKVPQLRAVFKKNGTVTAANASTLNDGACAMILMSEDALKKYGVQPLAVIRGFGDGGKDPIDFPTAPAVAMPRALENAGVRKDDVALWEINEAFSCVVLANAMIMELDMDKINVNGGAVSLGHPIGMSGARITAMLAQQLEKGQIGAAGICNGGGEASAIVVERV